MVKKRCKQCGKMFIINDSEIDFFKSKNLELPKRCNQCRKLNKKKNINNRDNGINNDKNIEKNTLNFEKNNNKEENNKGKRKVFRNVVITILVFLSLLLGKIFNIEPSWLNINSSVEKEQNNSTLQFRNDKLLQDHFLKHKSEFNYKTKEEYLNGARKIVISNSSIHKKENEDGDDIYYDKNKNEIVFVSKDGYIRTYFKPTEGIEYFNRQ